ncbi:MAG: TetR/AcrR family transcriptional regulator [Solirubrobacteraceae bacterium]
MSTAERPLRADAERNRRLLLDAARELFAQRGLQVTLDDIARAAGVGVGTAYRRFGTREKLIDALFEERVGGIVALAKEGLEADDPWEGLAGFLQRSLALQAADRGLKELLLGTAEGRERVAAIRAQMQPLGTELVRRAQEAGALRPDFAPQDIPLLQIMLGAIVDVSQSVQPELWQRYLALILDGMRAEGAPRTTSDVPPVEWSRVADVMSCWRPPQRRGPGDQLQATPAQP